MEDVQFFEGLYEIVKQNNEKDYSRVIEERASYPYLYHLAGSRANLVDWISIPASARVLEYNPECGALTEKLLQKAGEVTCIAENALCAEIIRERCSTKPRIVLRDAWDLEKETVRYDIILIVGDFWRYRRELVNLRKLLAENGRLIIADANRIGLRYLAGCQEEYRGGYFTGVEGYAAPPLDEGADGSEEARCFTRKEYTNILEAAGFGALRFYYPYPDYKFPSCIYSDERLPERGELIDNRRNFDRDRFQLFEEQYVYDTLIAEGLYDAFSNSFFIEARTCECGLDEKREEVIYCKYSDERNARFAIRTDIVKGLSGEKYVRKYALKKEGQTHIRHIEEAYAFLTEAYRDSGISFCSCEKSGMGIRFPFVRGESLAELLKKLCNSDRGREKAIEATLREYIRRIRAYGGEVPFCKTPEFIEVFGDVDIEEGIACASASDIDMIFSNILIDAEAQKEAGGTETVWNVIDYEWTFDFPVPKAFILYRGLYFAYYQILNDTAWRLADLFVLAGITEEQAAQFAEMEEHFQAYLGKGALPMRSIQRKMGTKVFSLKELACGGNGLEPEPESEWIRVKKIQYHIDRQEYQDGSVICCGWAFARTKDGRNLPVNIRVTDMADREVQAEVHRTLRQDVAGALKVKNVTKPYWGFDCVWVAPKSAEWKLHFSLGNRKMVYQAKK